MNINNVGSQKSTLKGTLCLTALVSLLGMQVAFATPGKGRQGKPNKGNTTGAVVRPGKVALIGNIVTASSDTAFLGTDNPGAGATTQAGVSYDSGGKDVGQACVLTTSFKWHREWSGKAYINVAYFETASVTAEAVWRIAPNIGPDVYNGVYACSTTSPVSLQCSLGGELVSPGIGVTFDSAVEHEEDSLNNHTDTPFPVTWPPSTPHYPNGPITSQISLQGWTTCKTDPGNRSEAWASMGIAFGPCLIGHGQLTPEEAFTFTTWPPGSNGKVARK